MTAFLLSSALQGDLVIWAYLYKNCSLSADVPVPSAGLEVNITLLDGTKPVGNVTLDGLVMTGTTNSAAAAAESTTSAP
jgi:hypothetical protein